LCTLCSDSPMKARGIPPPFMISLPPGKFSTPPNSGPVCSPDFFDGLPPPPFWFFLFTKFYHCCTGVIICPRVPVPGNSPRAPQFPSRRHFLVAKALFPFLFCFVGLIFFCGPPSSSSPEPSDTPFCPCQCPGHLCFFIRRFFRMFSWLLFALVVGSF